MAVSGVSVSVIIPALNEQSTIDRALRSSDRPGVQRIVVDGGSSDGTTDTARFLRADKVLQSLPGRAHQLDAGFREADGEILVFLHADTRLDDGWLRALRAAIADPEVSGGAFRLRFESPRFVYRVMEAGVWFRSRYLGLPYGDQALFVRKKWLDEAGGIAETPMFEDLDLVRLIRSQGRLVMLRSRAWTSARRYEHNGVVRTMARNLAALVAFEVGVDRGRIAAWYRRRPRT